MIRESLADSNQIQWQVLAKSLQLQLADSRLWQVLYIYSTSSKTSEQFFKYLKYLFNNFPFNDFVLCKNVDKTWTFF